MNKKILLGIAILVSFTGKGVCSQDERHYGLSEEAKAWKQVYDTMSEVGQKVKEGAKNFGEKIVEVVNNDVKMKVERDQALSDLFWGKK